MQLAVSAHIRQVCRCGIAPAAGFGLRAASSRECVDCLDEATVSHAVPHGDLRDGVDKPHRYTEGDQFKQQACADQAVSKSRVHSLSPSEVMLAEYRAEVFALWRDLGIACFWFVASVLVAGLVLFPLLFSL